MNNRQNWQEKVLSLRNQKSCIMQPKSVIKHLLVVLSVVVFNQVVIAQASYPVGMTAPSESSIPGLPPMPNDGACYELCKVPDETKKISYKKVLTPARTEYKIIPAQYRTVTERIQIKAPSIEYKVIPAQYKTVKERVEVRQARTEYMACSAQIDYLGEEKTVDPGIKGGYWAKVLKEDCDPSQGDCFVLCWKNNESESIKYMNATLKADATVEVQNIPAEYRMVNRQQLVSAARVQEVRSPAVYKTVTKQVLARPAEKKQVRLAAQTETITEEFIVKKGYYTWKTVSCDVIGNGGKGSFTSKGGTPLPEIGTRRTLTLKEAMTIQEKLKASGFYHGKIDGDIGVMTKQAIRQYKAKHNLNPGNDEVTEELLKALNMDVQLNIGD